MKLCGGLKSNGTPCKNIAGWGTDHVGTGKCKLHGGASLKGTAHPNFKHGRYATAMQNAVAATLGSDSDPLDILPELEVQRLFYADYLSRFSGDARPTDEDIERIIDWGSEIAKTAERAVKMKNETALTKAEVGYLAARIVDVVSEFIDDLDTRRAFVNRLFGSLSPVNAGAALGTGSEGESSA